MRIHHYNPATGLFNGSVQADPDPLVEGSFLIPANATDIEPPAPADGNLIVFRSGRWGYVHPLRFDAEPQDTPIEPDLELTRLGMPTLTSRQFWMAAANIGVTKESIVPVIDEMPDLTETEKLLLRVELNEASAYDRLSPSVIELSEALGITAAQLDDLWNWAAAL